MSKTQPATQDTEQLSIDYELLEKDDSYDTASEPETDSASEDDASVTSSEDDNEVNPTSEDDLDFYGDEDYWESPALKEDLAELERARDAADYARRMREQRAGAVHAQRIILSILGSAAGLVAVAYVAGLIYFGSHFAFHTALNDIDVSCQNASQTEALITQAAADYTLTIHGRNQVDGTIQGSAISLVLAADTSAADLIRTQSGFQWPKSLWTTQTISSTYQVSYDEAALESLVDALPFFATENIQQPSNAVCSYADGSYQITAGDPGSVPKREAILSAIKDAISANQTQITLGDECYEEAAITEDSAELVAATAELNKILNLSITMTFGDETQALTKDQLASFVSVSIAETSDADATAAETESAQQSASEGADTASAASEDTAASGEEQAANAQDADSQTNDILYNAEAVSAYVAALAEQYDTYGKDREFKTHTGETVTVSGGNYGWQMDQESTAAALLEVLKAEQDTEFTPVWTKEAASFGDTDIGTSYMEVDLDNQKVYQYIDGECVVETDCVSGKAIDSDRLTPDGTYSIVYRKSPAVLKGADYESPVTYWMPFNGGIGFHDATWRSKFGGELYLTGGSHGCINLPLSAAKEIYANVYSGMPVVVYGGMTSEEAIAYTGKKPDPPVSKKESEADIGGGISETDTDPANAAAAQQTEAQAAAAAATQAAQAAVIAQAQQNYMSQGMSAEEAAAQVQADLAAQLAAQQQAATGQ